MLALKIRPRGGICDLVAMSETFGVKFGRLVRRKREALDPGESEQGFVALKVGVRNEYLSRLENGRIDNPKDQIVRDLADYLQINRREIAELRGESVPTADLRDIAWLNVRVGRRKFLHPRDSSGEDPLPLVSTPILEELSLLLKGEKPAHLLIEGEIASGKSSLLELLRPCGQRGFP